LIGTEGLFVGLATDAAVIDIEEVEDGTELPDATGEFTLGVNAVVGVVEGTFLFCNCDVGGF
jgi:hypothetical protein